MIRNNIILISFLSCTVIFIFLLFMESITEITIVINDEYSEELLVDSRRRPTEKEIYEKIARDLSSSPIDFWRHNRNSNLRLNKTCAPYPNTFNLMYHNTYWQKYFNGNITYYLYAAYYDKRKSVVKTPVVRILAMFNQVKYRVPREYCQIWFDGSTVPVIVPIKKHNEIWKNEWGTDVTNNIYPHFITCELPKAKRNLIPQTVSLVSKKCDEATNNLRVTYEHPPAKATSKGKFGVCVKALWYPYKDISGRLVEWLEMLRILGAEKVFIYNLQMHPNITRVLEYYKRQGFVDFPRITLGRGEPDLPHFIQMTIKNDHYNYLINQMVQLNDCLYRNMNNYEYLAVIDIDEMIMPLGNLTTWPEIINALERMRKPDLCIASHCFQTAYYPSYPQYKLYVKDIPKYMYMLQHVRRVRAHVKLPLARKCFHNTNYVIAIHNHFPFSIVSGCMANKVKARMAQMQHYREPLKKIDLPYPIIDKNMWRFKDTLVQRSSLVFRKLGFLRKINVTKTKKTKKIT